MKLNIVAYLAKEGSTVEDIINLDKRPELIHIENDFVSTDLYLKRSSSEPHWCKLFTEADIDKRRFYQNTVKAVMVLKVNERSLVFTFGYAKSLLHMESMERGFGLRVSMNIGDPHQIKSIDKSTLDKVARNTKSQTSKNTGVEDFDFEFDHEILKSITAMVECSGLIVPDTLIRDNPRQRLRCQHESEKVV